LLNEQDSLHANTLEYYKYFLQNDFTLKVSTISIAEYCVKGQIQELPLAVTQIVPFNIDHARKAGAFAAIAFQHKNSLNLPDRRIIPNDTKLFAQADVEESIQKFATSDAECIKVYNLLTQHSKLTFDIIDIRKPYNETFGILDLK
jgi:hypothetical protein